MAKTKKTSIKDLKMNEDDAIDKPLQHGRSRFSKSKVSLPDDKNEIFSIFQIIKKSPAYATALTALFLSIIALCCASFAIWQNKKQVATGPSYPAINVLSNANQKRLMKLEAKVFNIEKGQMHAIAALEQRLDQQVSAVTSDEITKTEDSNNTVNGSNARVDLMAGAISQRLSALETTVKNLAVKTVIKDAEETGEIPNSEVKANADITPRQVSLLVISGLLADNLAGAPLGRWIDLLQKVTDQGIEVPHLDQLRLAANPTPPRPSQLIQSANDLVPKMTLALNWVSNDAGFLEKTGSKLSQLVRLRKIGNNVDGNAAALSAFEAALSAQDLDGAILAADRWSKPDLPSLKQWVALAQSRRDLDITISKLINNSLDSAVEAQ